MDYTDSVQYVSSFVGYFPAEKPQYSCIVVIHRPDKSKAITGQLWQLQFLNQEAKKNIQRHSQTNPLEASSLMDLIENTRSQGDLSVPNLTGLSEQEAIKKSQELGLKVLINGKGTVIEQLPEAGAKISNHQQVILKLS